MKGTYYICRHPIQTGQGVITSIAHPIQTYNAITEDLSEKSGTLRGQGSIAGGVLIGVATAGTVGIAAKTGTVAKVVRKLKRTPDVPDTNVPGGVAPRRVASAHSLERSEALSGRASRELVEELVAKMRNPKIGWPGKPIEVIEHNGYRYVVNGHHRLEAARRAGIEVPYEIIDEATLISKYGYRDIDHLIWNSCECGPNRL